MLNHCTSGISVFVEGKINGTCLTYKNLAEEPFFKLTDNVIFLLLIPSRFTYKFI